MDGIMMDQGWFISAYRWFSKCIHRMSRGLGGRITDWDNDKKLDISYT